ncbi:ScyD/ScyE family protein [Streptomyces sp. NPDC060000]|uniref:ScyD/ScyE family protein n=1 Tax=Streptomyces sp. NPDC060000 TaxID=3347031 RepID=UPI0036A8E16C
MSTVTAAAIPSQATTAAGAAVVVANDLHNPRSVRIQSDGSLVVAEAGSGPATPCAPPPAGERNRCLGFSGSLYRVAGSTKGRVVTGLPSEQINQNYGTSVLTRIAGAVQAESAGSTYRVSYGLSGLPAERISLGAGSDPLGTLSTAKGKVLGDLAAHEAANDPDSVNGNSEVFSNPWGFARDGKDHLVTDAGANDLIRVHADGTTTTEFVFPNNTLPAASGVHTATPAGQYQAVPTGIVRDRDGTFYIADMSGMVEGISRVWRYAPGSAPTVFVTGLTDVIDLALDPHGDLIALSYGSGLGSAPGPGALTRIDKKSGAVTAIDTGTTSLNQPTGLAVNAWGDIYVTNNTQSTTAGELLKFPAR